MVWDKISSMNDWIAAVQAELGLNVSFDTDAILDAARDAAHATERKAAPITTGSGTGCHHFVAR